MKIIVYFPFIFLLYDYKTACSVQKQVRENVCLLNRSLKACKTNVRSFLKNILKILSFKLILTIFNHFVLDFSSFDYFSFLWTIQIVCLSLDVFFWKTPFLKKKFRSEKRSYLYHITLLFSWRLSLKKYIVDCLCRLIFRSSMFMSTTNMTYSKFTEVIIERHYKSTKNKRTYTRRRSSRWHWQTWIQCMFPFFFAILRNIEFNKTDIF